MLLINRNDLRLRFQSLSSRKAGASMAASVNTGKSVHSKWSRKSKNNQSEIACIRKRTTRKIDSCVSVVLILEVKMSARNVISPKCQRNITKMLLLINSVFITLNLPRLVPWNGSKWSLCLCVMTYKLIFKNVALTSPTKKYPGAYWKSFLINLFSSCSI